MKHNEEDNVGIPDIILFLYEKTLSRYVGLTNGGALLLYDAAWPI